MAKKPLLDATSRPPSAYSAFTRNYRQSANVVDERAKQYRPSETPKDAEYAQVDRRRDIPKTVRGGSTGSAYGEDTRTFDQFGDDNLMYGGKSGSDTTPTSSTRKTSPEDAIRKTHIERK